MKATLYATILALVVCAWAIADTYTVSIGGDDSDGIYLLKIDELGNVLKGPVEAATEAQLGGDCDCPTGLFPIDAAKMGIITANENGNFMRLIIDKKTLKAIAIKRISLQSTDRDVISTSQVAKPLFVTIERDPSTAWAYGLTSTGLPNGSRWRLVPRTDGGSDEAHVSADGLMAVTADFDPSVEQLYVQPLKANGIPNGLPAVIATADMEGPDITNPLPGNRRFVVWRDSDTSVISLQVVAADTGVKLGGRRTIVTADAEEEDQGLAIDPMGRFLLYNEDGENYGCSNNDILLYQGLDSNGFPSGQPKIVAGCAFVAAVGYQDDMLGIDIMMD